MTSVEDASQQQPFLQPSQKQQKQQQQSQPQQQQNNLIDRRKVCPFLLRVFLCDGRHHPMSEYTNRKIPPTARELQIYTWLDATLAELMGLIREIAEYRGKGTQFSFSVVYPEPSSPTYKMRHIGFTIGGKRGPHDELTLSQCRLQIGDYIDVAILPMGADISKLNNQIFQNNKKNRTRNRGTGAGRFRPR